MSRKYLLSKAFEFRSFSSEKMPFHFVIFPLDKCGRKMTILFISNDKAFSAILSHATDKKPTTKLHNRSFLFWIWLFWGFIGLASTFYFYWRDFSRNSFMNRKAIVRFNRISFTIRWFFFGLNKNNKRICGHFIQK